MHKGRDQLVILWDDLLSRQPKSIKAAFASLGETDQQKVLEHLQRMVNEPGWQPEQRLSAEAALRVFVAHPDQGK